MLAEDDRRWFTINIGVCHQKCKNGRSTKNGDSIRDLGSGPVTLTDARASPQRPISRLR